MAEGEGKYKISDIYQGGYSSFAPNYGDSFTGYRTTASKIGISTDPRTADVLTEFSTKIAPGQKAIELSMITPAVFESVPKQHLKEIQRLSKLTGVDVTVHGPLVEPSGMTQQGFSEANREATERQMILAVERSHDISREGNVPVTFHSSAQLPGPEVKKTKDGEEIERLYIINRDTNQVNVVKKETRFYPDEPKELEKGKTYDVLKEVDIMNESEWDNSLSQLVFNKDRADQILAENYPLVKNIYPQIINREVSLKDLPPTQREAVERVFNAQEFLKNTQLTARSLFNRAYKYGTDNEKIELKKIAEEFSEGLYIEGEINGKKVKGMNPDPKVQSQVLQGLINNLERVNPKLYMPLDEFAQQKTSTTFGNVAFQSYKKFGESAPIISIENPPAGSGFARGEDLKNIVEDSRKQFVNNAMKDGMSESQATKAAEKLIGVTWDVGHINMLRKFGFDEKDLLKEAEKVAPYVKHVHLSDNFGMEHTELPMGMGNVPLQEMMKKLGKSAEQAKKIVEAGNWWQHFKSSPIYDSFKSMGSPIYGMKAPYFNQALGYQQGYFSGYGAFLPQVNYETMGAGFFNLPTELGGQRQQTPGGRMGGRPME